jgi:hypothetical protein
VTSPATETETAETDAAAGAPTGSRLPDLTYTEQETELRAAVRSVLEEKAEAAAVLARTETPDTYDADLWRTLAAEGGGRRRGDRAVGRAGAVPWQRRDRHGRGA